MPEISSLVRKTIYSIAGARRIVSRQSLLKVAFIVSFVLSFEVFATILFMWVFRFLDQLGGIGIIVIPKLFSLFFLGISFMLVVSSTVTSYATMYRSREIPFLVVRPYSISQIVMAKFLESCLLSSWAFFFVIAPFVGAYAARQDLSPVIIVWTLLFALPLSILCSAVGTVITMIVTRWFPSGRFLRIAAIAVVLVALVFMWHSTRGAAESNGPAQLVLTRIIPGLKLSTHPLLPGWTVSEGILSLSRGRWGRGIMLWLTLCANAAFLYLVVEALGKAVFYEGWQRVLGRGDMSGARRALLPRLDANLRFLADDMRAIAIKDIRVLLRDPMQWSQFLVFFGLLGLYFSSLRSFDYHTLDDQVRSFIVFLNVFSVSTVMCSLASRFIYPQLSLEGQSFWILGLAPTTMGRILAAKFSLAVTGMIAVSSLLMYLSTQTLKVTVDMQLSAIGLAVAVSFAVSGLSTGLGAIFLDLKQRNPAAIVSGFGGTLNLVLSLAFMVATVIPFAVAFHARFLRVLRPGSFALAIWACSVWATLLTLAATIVPLYLGRKALRLREY